LGTQVNVAATRFEEWGSGRRFRLSRVVIAV
jgi:hypothetical protein